MKTIKFGTDGWRGVISDDFTFENVRICAQAIADYVKESDLPQVILIGYDARFMSEYYAKECIRVVTANGIKVLVADKVTATPVVSYGVKQYGVAGAIVVTASHNPAEYNGIKYKAYYGGSALPNIMMEIEKFLYKNSVQTITIGEAENGGLIELCNFDKPYAEHIRSLVDLQVISGSGIKAVIDPMYGAGSGYLKDFLKDLEVDVVEIRGERNPSFCGINPEPIEKNLLALKEAVLNSGSWVGLATDGDADRVGAIDANGTFINSHQIYALFLRHLVEKRGWKGGVVKTFSTSQMIDKLARKYGLKTYETPIGFKYICELFLKKDILLGGEESGGIGFKNHIPERDGILSSLLLLEIMATYGKPLGEILNELMNEIGYHYYDRVDLHITEEQKKKAMDKLYTNPPEMFHDILIKEIQRLDGVKFILEDDSWILFRASGTEPVVRVYAEADSKDKVTELLKTGREIIGLK
jgi:alpha-D-glucose phosphate-specific phosphoglucomutase